MLMLTRKSGEGILLEIGGKQVARIIVQNCRDKKTQVGIDAGPEVTVLREELCQATAESDSEPPERE
ncbi:MAG: carbon storage regulator [Fuerstiella sp.]|nr:carbon storage regulator [Fuerstiella sp.]